MIDREKVQKGLYLCLSGEASACNDCPYDVECGETVCVGPSPLRRDVLELLKELPEVIRCKDCKNWIAGYITGQDEFIAPKCGKYRQMVGHSNDDFCSLAERREV